MEELKLRCVYHMNDYIEVSKNTNDDLMIYCSDGEQTEVYLSEEDAKKMCDHIKLIFGWE